MLDRKNDNPGIIIHFNYIFLIHRHVLLTFQHLIKKKVAAYPSNKDYVR